MPQVRLFDGTDVRESAMQWGAPGCWPTGSDSNISKDFVVRGVYYPQLLRFLQFFPLVSTPSHPLSWLACDRVGDALMQPRLHCSLQ